ncbi:MAG: VOC family protein [Gilliamella sp.]|uniref:VOC family protein n=1 Tax=Lactobacillus TaxID=1578 RepID=UPI0022E7F5D1|nr:MULTISPECIES: VOC family protein [Lactobacillus]MCO6531201.1 VOC family protein [Lactobacillus sp.]MCO6547526.1 VOC family protein [Gilliamella sp.]
MNILKGISHVGIPTDNFAKSVHDYEKIGFKLVNQEDNQGSATGFFQLGNLELEVWETKVNSVNGAINHYAIDTDEIDQAFELIKGMGFKLINQKIMHLPFWDHGISYFNFYGPNNEIIEICQRNKK